MVNNPGISILTHADSGTATTAKSGTGKMPVNLALKNLSVNHGSLSYTSVKAGDSTIINNAFEISAKDLQTNKNQAKLIAYDSAEIDITDTHLKKRNIEVLVPKSSIALSNGELIKNENSPISFSTGLLFEWTDLKFENKKTDTTGIAIEKLSGFFNDTSFSVYPKVKMKWRTLVDHATITDGAVLYNGREITAKVGSLAWNKPDNSNMLSVYSFSVLPKLSSEETFKNAQWQKDYMTVAGEAIHISGIHFNQQANDSTLEIKKVVAENVDLTTLRDKRIPFQHGVYKTMPTILISAIKMPLRIDSVFVLNSNVNVGEISAKTNKQGTVPLQEINAILTNVSNAPGKNDSLTIVGNAKFLNHYIRYMHYSEAYGDSLSNFYMTVNVSPLHLPVLNNIIVPLASVSIERGNSDTLYAVWAGNNNAAVGKMDFYYKDLKVRVLDKDDTSKNSLKLKLINSLANGVVIRKSNSKSSQIYFERDKEKFVFNYWIKTVLRGLTTSAGVKKNKKATKQYKKVQEEYSLPGNPYQ